MNSAAFRARLAHSRPPLAGRRRGVTLIEVIVAAGILAMVMMAYIAAVYFSYGMTWKNRNHLYAMQLVSYYENMILASNFEKLGDPNVVAPDFEAKFKDSIEVKPDPAAETRVRVCQVGFLHTGWGRVEKGTNNTLVANLAENQEEWETDIWKGHFLCITTGRGAGQIVLIKSNTEKTLTITGDLSGKTDVDWTTVPDSSSEYLIDNGKYVQIRVSWTDSKDASPKEITRMVLVKKP